VRALALAVLLLGCSDSTLPQADNGVIFVAQSTGSGVYLGHGVFMTAWHVCFTPLFDESLGDDDRLRYFHEGYYEGAAPDSYYCQTSTAPDVDWTVSAADQGGCLPISKLPGYTLSLTRVDREAFARNALFADWTLDVCLFDVDAETAAVLDERLAPIAVEPEPVRVGQKVVVAGHQIDALNDVGAEGCEVIRGVEDVLDPDPIQPSPLVVPSFAVDCRQVEHGSSGSPVFDAESGRLLGVVWTGVDLGTDEAVVYVSAASEWRAHLASRPAAQYTQISRLFQ